MTSYNNQASQNNKTLKLAKKIIGCAFIFVCATSSVSAMFANLKPLGLSARKLNGRLQSTLHTSNREHTLSDRFKTYRQELVEFSTQRTHTNLYNEKIELFKKDGSALFHETALSSADSLDIIDTKISIAEGLFDLQPYLSFVGKEDIISVCNESIMSKISCSNEHLKGALMFVSLCVDYRFPVSSKITYNQIEASLSKITETEDKDNQKLLEKIISQAKENHGLTLVGTFGGGCGFL